MTILPIYNIIALPGAKLWLQTNLYKELTDKTVDSDGNVIYTAEFDLNFKNIIINNGSGEQTVDIIYNDKVTGYYPTEKNSGGKWLVETYTGNPPSKNNYTDANGKVISLSEVISREADDTALTGIGNEFKNLQILGVQKKTESTANSVRFVTVVNRDILNDAEDYGYIPKYEIFEYIKKKYPYDEFVSIGDRASDFEAGIKNGFTTIGCEYGFGTKEELSQCDTTVKSVWEIVMLFE